MKSVLLTSILVLGSQLLTGAYSDNGPQGHGVQVVNVVNGKFELDTDVLISILHSPKCKDRPVAVISIAGAFRKGKSFLLNFILRYLDRQGWNKDGQWLLSGSPNEKLQGFEWLSRTDTVTIGIHMWSEPFVVPVQGKDVCVLVMDTQGLYDSEHSLKNTALIFALSTLTSSLQIFNLKEHIQEDDLQTIDMFSAYGKLMSQQDPTHSPFQKLLFLIRDWPYPDEYKYGFNGGQTYLDWRLSVGMNTPEEGRKVRENIKSYYENVSCFLMPHPGMIVSRKTFRGELKDLEEDFTVQLQTFVDVLVTRIVSPKRIASADMTGRQLMEYFKSYFTIFQNGSIPAPQTMLDATAEAANRAAMSTAQDYYLDKMNEAVSGTPEPNELEARNQEIMTEAFAIFDRVPKIGEGKKTDEYRSKLTEFIDTNWNRFRESNTEKYNNLAHLENMNAKSSAIQRYMERMNDLLNTRSAEKNFIEMSQLEERHRISMSEAIDLFNVMKTKGDTKLKESFRSQLQQEMDGKWQVIRTDNEQKERIARQMEEEARRKREEELARQREEEQRRIEEERRLAEINQWRLWKVQFSCGGIVHGPYMDYNGQRICWNGGTWLCRYVVCQMWGLFRTVERWACGVGVVPPVGYSA